MNNSPMILTRRAFLQSAGALAGVSALGTLQGLGLSNALAQSAPPSDYKALVCIFLFGGNDGNNWVIPRDNAAYNLYSSARGGTTNGGIAIAQSALVAINPRSVSAGFGLHPQFAPMKSVWDAGKLAVLCNVGPLVEPLTKSEYSQGVKDRPEQLFSHSDQQAQWQAAISDQAARTGWGGRLADVIDVQNGASTMPMIASVAGSAFFTIGNTPNTVAIPSTGSFGLTGFNTTTASTARLNALRELLLLNSSNEFVREADDIFAQAIDSSNVINPIITGATTSLNSLFPTPATSISNQLLQVARLINARATIGLKRQIFFVSLGGFDTHAGQINTQDGLFAQLAPAMKAFYDATVQMGVADQVTTFTLSDFGRTLKLASGGGSDHAWGNHHLIMGGAVRGGDFYGRFPDHALGGPDDVSTNGRWLPTTSVDQYAATLARWLGVSASDMPLVLPNIGRFSNTNLGFLG
ncbi:MAG: DUF1501 domain-containing protein [Betaproteobacteria bacterium]|nr:DUF1501 domain-containing protein [Betaproteobacteria bacterium]